MRIDSNHICSANKNLENKLANVVNKERYKLLGEAVTLLRFQTASTASLNDQIQERIYIEMPFHVTSPLPLTVPLFVLVFCLPHHKASTS